MKRRLLLLVGLCLVAAVALGSTIRDDVDRVMSGSWVFTGSVTLPANSVDEDNVTTAALFAADNLMARFPVFTEQAAGSAVTAQTHVVHVAAYAGAVTGVEAVCATAPTGDYTITVDVQKSTGGAAFATILTATFDLDSGNSDRVLEAGTVDGTKDDYADGDILQVVVTVSGSTGTQGQGLCVTVFCEEEPTS